MSVHAFAFVDSTSSHSSHESSAFQSDFLITKSVDLGVHVFRCEQKDGSTVIASTRPTSSLLDCYRLSHDLCIRIR
jgi:hypothetical protein